MHLVLHLGKDIVALRASSLACIYQDFHFFHAMDEFVHQSNQFSRHRTRFYRAPTSKPTEHRRKMSKSCLPAKSSVVLG